MVSNMHSCHSTETMPWLVILTNRLSTTVPLRLTEIFLQSMDSNTSEGSRCRHHVDFSKWAKKRPAIHPLARPKTRSFVLSATYPLNEVLLKVNRSIWHPLLEKNRPKAKAKDTVSSFPNFPKTGKQHLPLWPATHLPRSNHRLLWAAIMHTPHCAHAHAPVCVCVCVRYETPFSSCHESGPSLFLSTGKHPVVGQLPRVSFSALPGESSDRPNLPPHQKLSIFQFPFSSIQRAPSEAHRRVGKRGTDRSTSKRSSKKLQRAAITALFLDRSLVVVHYDQSWPDDDRVENHCHCCAYCMPHASTGSKSTGAGSNHMRFAGSVSCFTCTSIAIDCACRSSCGAIMPAIVRKCFDCKQTTSHGLVLCVYASQLNWGCTAFEHVETKTEDVFFWRRSWLSFIGVHSEIVRSYDRHLPEVVPWLNFTPDPQQLQAERFSLYWGPISQPSPTDIKVAVT